MRHYHRFGDVAPPRGRVVRSHFVEPADQEEALTLLTRIARDSSTSPVVIEAARRIISHECQARDEKCQIEAIFTAVKHGTQWVPGLESGVYYASDPAMADTFTSPERLLLNCAEGHCVEDCDGASALIAALLSAVGYETGLCAWGKKKSSFGTPDYDHVFAVVKYPRATGAGLKQWVALDSTVADSYPGWHPPRGYYKVKFLGDV